MEDQQPHTDQREATDLGYTPDQPLRIFLENIKIQVALYPMVRDEYCEKIAKSFAVLDWHPTADGINNLRKELEKPWRKAILTDWELSHETLKVLRTALNESGSSLVSGTMTVLTDNLLDDINEEEPVDNQRKRELLDEARIDSIQDNSREHVNWLRLRNSMDISQIRVPGQADLRSQVKNTQLSSLLRHGLLAAKRHAELFILVDDAPGKMGSDTHLEAFETAKTTARELIDQLRDALTEDMVELICDQTERLEELRETLIRAFITTVLAFATVEARWAVFYHPSAMGKCHGHAVMEMIEELRNDDRLLNTQLRAAGALIAALKPSERWGLLQDLRELAYLVASEVPALGSHVGAETLHRQIRSSTYKGAGQEDEELEVSAPRTSTLNTYFARPPTYAKVNGDLMAPLAGPLGKNEPLKELKESIGKNWSTRPVREALVTHNATTLLVETLRTLPDLRMSNSKQKKRGNTEKNIPAIHQRFLQQSTLTNADDYLVAAEDEVTYIRENHWKHDVLEKVEEIRHKKKGRDLDIFVRWLKNYEHEGHSELVTCWCKDRFRPGRNPTGGVIAHLNRRHNRAVTSPPQAGDAQDGHPDPESNNSLKIYNPYSQPAKKKAKRDKNKGPSTSGAQGSQGQKRPHAHMGPETGYNRRPDHDERARRHDRSDRSDRADRDGRDNRRDQPDRRERGDRDDRRSRGDRSGREDSDGPRPRK